MNNKFTSPLYHYVKTEIGFRGIRHIGKKNIELAYDAIVILIANCCVLRFPPTKSMYLKIFYALLHTMVTPRDLRKLKEVKKLLEPYVSNNCC